VTELSSQFAPRQRKGIYRGEPCAAIVSEEKRVAALID